MRRVRTSCRPRAAENPSTKAHRELADRGGSTYRGSEIREQDLKFRLHGPSGDNVMPEKDTAADSRAFKWKWSPKLVAALTMLTILQLGSVLAAPPAGASHRSGEQLYTEYCAKCHSNAHAVRVPQLSVLRAMGPRLD